MAETGDAGRGDAQGAEAMTMKSRIAIDPNVCHGQARVRGTRIPVHQILAMLANGDTVGRLFEPTF
jgi:uncharacterized protein (DUF433 family)